MKDRTNLNKESSGLTNVKAKNELDPESLGITYAQADFLESIPGSQRADNVLKMQRTVGNRAVQREVAPVQKLDLGGLLGGGGGGIMESIGGLLGGGGGGGLGGMLGGLLGGGGGGGGGGLGGMLGGLLGGGGGGIGSMLGGLMGRASEAAGGLVERGRGLLGGLFG
jgi:hypothetical protein